MNIQHKQEDGNGIFYIADGTVTLAKLVYAETADNILTIEHTEVSDALRGKNIGFLLVNAAAEYARAQHLKIISLCTFAKSVLDKKKDEFADVLKSN